uniref:Mitochondrial fission factor n=1 Tax=Eptatretus burgeri TaxID=7764 RepID=A0A8C4Q574_EPTBU
MPAPDETSRTDPCDSNFLEDIGNKMTIPRRLQVVSEPENVAESRTKMPMLQTGDCDGQHRLNANLMEVPDRIVLADGAKSRPKGLSWESFSAEGVLKEQLLLRTPPRVLTLQEQPLDYISLDPAPFHSTASKSEAAGRVRNRMIFSSFIPYIWPLHQGCKLILWDAELGLEGVAERAAVVERVGPQWHA